MRISWLRDTVLVAVLALAGCSRNEPVDPQVAPEDTQTRLGESIDIDLAAWHKLPRKELARLGDEWAETVEKQLSPIRKNPESFDLLPRLLPPLLVPVFHQSKFSPAANLSLPSYADAGKKDALLALHLARWGDHEAASRLAPDDGSATSAITSVKTEKNYPVEWTRLVSLVLYSSQLKLGTGDVEGATEISLLHRQLTSLLDTRAASGPLGSALLSMGKKALTEAAVAWRAPRRNKTALADDLDKVVTNWGNVPAPVAALPLGSSRAEVAAVFGVAPRGKVVLAAQPASIARTADLLGLPLPPDGLRCVVAFLDGADRLAEVQLAYRPKIDTLYPTPGDLAYRLNEQGYAAKDEVKSGSLIRQTFTGGVVCEVVRSNRSLALGGLVRLVAVKDPTPAAASRAFRSFGPVDLDRGFEANRLVVSPAQTGAMVVVKDRKALEQIGTSLDVPTPAIAVLQRERDLDLVAALDLSWVPDDNASALDRLLPSLWSAFGPGKLEEADAKSGSYLGLSWKDAQTNILLRLPFDEAAPVLVIKDSQGTDKIPSRLEAVDRRDEQDRQARLAADRAETRLPRSPGVVNDFSLEGLQLGQSKSVAEAALPTGRTYPRKEVPEGTSVVVLTAPPDKAPYWARQILVRYQGDRVVEIRVRYQPGIAKKGQTLLDRLTAQDGAAQPLTPTWPGMWSDVGGPRKVVALRWRDDRTLRFYQEDAGCIEVVLRDRPAGSSSVDLPSWAFLSRGVMGCELGATRQTIEAARKGPAAMSGGAEVYRCPASSPYEMIMVWYQDGKATRILAVHREKVGAKPEEVTAGLNKAWGRDLGGLGYVRWREGARGKVLGSYYWNDDQVRARASVETGDQGQRLLSEWRTWPFGPARPGAKPDPTRRPVVAGK